MLQFSQALGHANKNKFNRAFHCKINALKQQEFIPLWTFWSGSYGLMCLIVLVLDWTVQHKPLKNSIMFIHQIYFSFSSWAEWTIPTE